jgi:hypothetical protein
MLTHSYIPDDFARVCLIPIVQNKCADVTGKDNYRPMALATVASKLMEMLILQRCDNKDAQFGFKSNHSTVVCFMDASKAFGRVNHWTLYHKMLKRGVPVYIVRLLVNCYIVQLFCVRWGTAVSSSFNVSNGVWQGGILSPKLFTVYMDELIERLNATGVGCYIGGKCVNNLWYADDTAFLRTSVKSMN